MSGESRRNIILAQCFISLISMNLGLLFRTLVTDPILYIYVMVVVLRFVLIMTCQNLYDLLLVFFLLNSYY